MEQIWFQVMSADATKEGWAYIFPPDFHLSLMLMLNTGIFPSHITCLSHMTNKSEQYEGHQKKRAAVLSCIREVAFTLYFT